MRTLRYSRNSAQSIPNSTITIVNFDDYDFGDSGVTVGAAWKYTCPEAGEYFVSALANYVATLMIFGSLFAGYIYKNGAVEYKIMKEIEQGRTMEYPVFLNGILSCVAGDTIDFRLSQSNGGAINLSADASRNRIFIMKVNP